MISGLGSAVSQGIGAYYQYGKGYEKQLELKQKYNQTKV